MASIAWNLLFKQKEIPVELCEHQKSSGTFSPLENRNEASEVNNEKGIEECLVCKTKEKAITKYRRKLIAGLALPVLIQALDTTILAGAITTIASDFNQLSQLNWIVASYNLTSATFIPFWGQFADIFGRYAALQIALSFMLLGSILSSAAPTTAFPMLLLGRAFHGIGCSGCLITSKVVLADKVSLKENAKNNTLFTVVAGIGYGIGPVIGGYLTEANWRWCFIINIPLGLIGLLLIHFLLRSELIGAQRIETSSPSNPSPKPPTFTTRFLTFDFGGQLLFLFGLGLLVLALTWGGSTYPWTSIKVIIPLILGVLLIVGFLIWEYNLLPTHYLATRFPTQKPMIPFHLLTKRNAWILLYINLITGMCMYAVFYFVSIYFTLVQSFAPGKSGTSLTYYLPGLAGGAYLAILLTTQTFFPLLTGTLLEALGITVLATALQADNLKLIYGMLVLTGIGTGLRIMPGTLHGVGYFPTQISSIVSLMSLATSLGGVISTTLLLNIFNNTISSSDLNAISSAKTATSEAIAGLPSGIRDAFRDDARRGIVLGFFALSAFAWVGCVVVLGLGNVWVEKGGEGKGEVVEGSYLGSLVGGRKEEVGENV
ncbi:MFS general substrate transporter [Glarea lozoyensis ATCC 20868]|uniref:MFS general substrate transporter n=1 Tax=Glarea lozoyensis (strain ATCC 20868 / MF5171) TaxID=1116229 RepID=S3DJM0_GLAL2|nr:MFS general substrate transporter [Glarea lozoyensis ATCC 20868]EPE32231.1 MFS general substrate transporter [Glarea lozoyensis ATCC 20868]